MGVVATPRGDVSAQSREMRLHRAVSTMDFLMVILAVGIGMAAGWSDSGWPIVNDPARLTVVASLVVIWPLTLWDMETRATSIMGFGPEEYRRVLVASLWTLAFTAAIAYASGSTSARTLLLGSFLVGLVLLFLGRNIMRTVLHNNLRVKDPLHRVFVVAPHSQATLISRQLSKTRGIYGEIGVWPIDGGDDPEPETVVNAATAASADTLLYAPGNHDDPSWPRRLGWAMEDSEMDLLVSPSITEIAGPRLAIEPLQGLPLVRVEIPEFTGTARVFKRATDIIGSLAVLIVLAIPMLIIGAVIRLTSEGPAFFRQPRAGADDKIFMCFKYRTMFVGADSQRAALRESTNSDSATFKMEKDPRITGIGHFLRRFSLDELPQLINVLKGDMSLVGPRPHPLDDVELYDDVATRRLLTKPGMTGLWQVSGRSDLEWDDAVMLDLYYVENWSMSLDFIIMLRTIKAVITGRGAY